MASLNTATEGQEGWNGASNAQPMTWLGGENGTGVDITTTTTSPIPRCESVPVSLCFNNAILGPTERGPVDPQACHGLPDDSAVLGSWLRGCGSISGAVLRMMTMGGPVAPKGDCWVLKV